MADQDDKLTDKKPNSLEKIGESGQFSKFGSDLTLMQQRSQIETVEMRRLRQQIENLKLENERVMQQVARVRSGFEPASEQLFRSLGMQAEPARVAMQSIAPDKLGEAAVRQSAKYEETYKTELAGLQRKYAERQSARAADAQRLFQQHVISSVSHPRQGVRSIQKMPGFETGVERYASVATEEELAKGLMRNIRSQELAGARLAEAAADVSSPEGRKRFLQLESEYRQKLVKTEQIRSAIGRQEEQEAQRQKQVTYAQRNIEDIGYRRQGFEIREGLRKGEYGSITDISKRVDDASKSLVDAFNKVQTELKEFGKTTKSTHDNLLRANEEYEKQHRILKEAGEGGAGGIGGGGRFGKFISGAAAAMPYVAQGVQLAQYGFVGADMQQMALRAQAASMSNQEYFDTLGAARGDMSALRRLSTSVYGRSVSTGAAYGTRAVVGGGVGAAVQGVTGVAQGIIGTLALASGNPLAMAFGGQTLAAGAGGVLDAGKSAIDLGKGITRAQAALQTTGLSRQIDDATYAAFDAANQALYDYRMSAYQSTMGAGTKTGTMYNKAVAPETMRQLAGFGLAPEQGAALFGLGARAIGADFTRSKDMGAGIVARGAELQQARVMGADDYIRRVGQMSNVGGGQKEVEEILANAVRRGVDDAKSLEGLFNLTQMLSRSSASMGVSGALETQRSLTRGLDTLGGAPMNEMLKQALVSNVFEKAQGISARAGQDIQTIKYLNKIKSNDPSVNMLEALNMSRMKPDLVASMQEQYFKGMKGGESVNPATIAALSAVPGALSTFLTKDMRYKGAGAVGGLQSALVQKGLDYSMALVQSPKASKELQDFVEGRISQNQLSPEAIRASENYPGGLVGLSMMRHGGAAPGVFKPGALPGEAGAAQQAEKAASMSRANQISQATMSMGQIAEMASYAAESGDAGAAAIRAAKAATSITLDASRFDASVTKFEDAVQQLINAVTPMGGRYDQRPPLPSEIDRMNAEKKQGSWIGNLFK